MAVHAGPDVITNSLVLHLDAGNIKSYPGSGSTWFDLTENGQSPSVSALTYNTNSLGALNMPNGSEFLSITPTSSLATTFASGDFSIETIIQSTNVVYPRSRHPMYVQDNPTSNSVKGWSVGHGATTSSIEVRVCDGTNLNNGFISHTVQQSTTYHRVFTVSRSSGVLTKYYVNSVLMGEVSSPTVTGTLYTSGGLTFGNVWGWRYIGDLYTIKVYNRVLTTSEITQNFNATRGRYGI